MEADPTNIGLSMLVRMVSNPKGAVIAAAVVGTFFALLFSPRWLWWALAGMLATSTLAPYVGHDDKWHQPVAPLDQVVLYGRALTAMMLLASLAGLITYPFRSQQWRVPPASVAFFSLHLLLCVRQFFGGSPQEGASRLAIYALVFLAFGILVPSLIGSTQDLRRLVRSLGLAALGFALLNVLTMALGYHYGFVHGRWFGLTGNPNAAAMVSALLLPASVGMAMLKSEAKLWRLTFWVTSGVLVFVILLSESRGGALTAIVGMIFLFRTQLGSLIFVLVPLTVVLIIVLGWAGYETYHFNRFASTDNTRESAFLFMIDQWLSSPVFGSASGWGVGENAYLGVLVRTGIIGGLVMIVVGFVILTLMARAILNRNAMGQDAATVDIAVGGLMAVAANSMLEATFFSNLNQTIFIIYLYLAVLDSVCRVAPTASPTHRVPPEPSFAVSRVGATYMSRG